MPAEFFVQRGERLVGPMSTGRLQEALRTGRVLAGDRVARSDQGPWKQVSDIPFLQRLIPTNTNDDDWLMPDPDVDNELVDPYASETGRVDSGKQKVTEPIAAENRSLSPFAWIGIGVIGISTVAIAVAGFLWLIPEPDPDAERKFSDRVNQMVEDAEANRQQLAPPTKEELQQRLKKGAATLGIAAMKMKLRSKARKARDRMGVTVDNMPNFSWRNGVDVEVKISGDSYEGEATFYANPNNVTAKFLAGRSEKKWRFVGLKDPSKWGLRAAHLLIYLNEKID